MAGARWRMANVQGNRGFFQMTEEEAEAWVSRAWTRATTRAGAEIEFAIGRAGRNAGPGILADAYAARLIGHEELHDLLAGVWSMAEYPESSLARKTWVHLFRTAALFPDRPRPITAYRGAVPSRRTGMAWTTSMDTARWFAGRWTGIGRHAFVYRTRLEPAAVLCDVNAVEGDGGRGEHEIVVDPRLLGKIERLEKVGELVAKVWRVPPK